MVPVIMPFHAVIILSSSPGGMRFKRAWGILYDQGVERDQSCSAILLSERLQGPLQLALTAIVEMPRYVQFCSQLSFPL